MSQIRIMSLLVALIYSGCASSPIQVREVKRDILKPIENVAYFEASEAGKLHFLLDYIFDNKRFNSVSELASFLNSIGQNKVVLRRPEELRFENVETHIKLYFKDEGLEIVRFEYYPYRSSADFDKPTIVYPKEN